jgi:hypothetical protein
MRAGMKLLPSGSLAGLLILASPIPLHAQAAWESGLTTDAIPKG